MLKEYKDVRQEKNSYRRYFTDAYFDLFIWYDKKEGHLIGFQLCYDKGRYSRALTWEVDKGFSHDRIDEGEDGKGVIKRTPILVPDGIFNTQRIALLFKKSSKLLENSISDLIYNKLLEYDDSKTHYFT